MIRRAALLAALAALAVAPAAQAGGLDTASVVRVSPAGSHGVRVLVRAPGDLSVAGVSARLGQAWADIQDVHRVGPKRPLRLVFAVDTSGSMAGGPMTAAIASGQRLLSGVGSGDQVALVTFSNQARVLAPLTPDVAAVRGALDTVVPSNGTALYDGVLTAVKAAGDDPSARRVVVVLSDGADTVSHEGLGPVVKRLAAAGVEVDTVGLIDSSSFTAAPLQEMAHATGGRFVSTSSVSGLGPLVAQLSRDRLSTTYSVQVGLPQSSSRVLHLTVNGSPAAPLSLPAGVSGTSPSLWTRFGAWVVAALGFGAVLTFSLLVFRLTGRRQPTLAARLSRYDAEAGKAHDEHRAHAVSDLNALLESRLAGRVLWQRLDALCQQAGSTGATGVVLTVMGAAAVLLGLLGWVIMGPLGVLLGLVAGPLAPLSALRLRARRRAKAFEAQLPDLLNVWASALRAGRSFVQALDTLVLEAGEPARAEFLHAQRQVRLGVPVEQALDELSKRLRSDSFELVVLTTDVQRRVGGNVATIFDQVADTVRKRQQFAARVSALTSMGRMSANVLLGLPFVMGAILTLINRHYMSPLFTTHVGHVLIVIAICMMSLGAMILRRMVKPRVVA